MNTHVVHSHIRRSPPTAYRREVEKLLDKTDIVIGGSRPWDIMVNDPRFYQRVLAHGSLGLGESYMDGWWDCRDLDGMIFRLLQAQLDRYVTWDVRLAALRARFINLQVGDRAFEIGRRHYDLGNELFQKMLGKRLVYSCGYWKDATTLDDAQEAKLDLVCRKLDLRPGMQVLDIGCGWGEALKFAAERYGVGGVGITVSKEQQAYAQELCKGLPIEIKLMDYRNVHLKFDRVYSIGMFEHVGWKNYRTYMEVTRGALKPNGLSLLHCIGGNETVHDTDPWIAKYIFPDGMLPSIRQIGTAIEGLFVMEDWHNFSAYYDNTLLAWRDNVETNWNTIEDKFDERFRRMWLFYLGSCAATFRARKSQLWQVVLSPNGVRGVYEAPR